MSNGSDGYWRKLKNRPKESEQPQPFSIPDSIVSDADVEKAITFLVTMRLFNHLQSVPKHVMQREMRKFLKYYHNYKGLTR